MGSFCSCSGSIKLHDIIIPNNSSFHNKSMESLPKISKLKRKKTHNYTRYKTCNSPKKQKNPEKRKTMDFSKRNSNCSSNSFLFPHKIINNSKISQNLLNKLYSIYKPLEDNIPVEDIELLVGEGMEYKGEWNRFKEKRHGRGILLINKEKLFYGYWKNDKINGFGKQIYCEMNNDDFNDIDIFSENKNYSYYIGEWKNNYQEGKGKEFWIDGTYYEGEYKNGKKWGEGKLVLPNGSIYTGQFKDGEINGKGKIVYSDKREYDGEWLNNKFNGKGVFTWPDGRKYSGSYLNNLKDGFGIFEWPNGKIYKGQWLKGKQNAEGEIYDPIKDKWTSGKWNMGKKVKYDIFQ